MRLGPRGPPGAWTDGTRVVKQGSLREDHHQDGAGATVVGSFQPPAELGPAAFYFVRWDDDAAGWPYGIVGHRLRLLIA